MGCGCSGSAQAKNARRPAREQLSPSQVPGGPGRPGFTWDGPKGKRAGAGAGGAGAKKK